MGKVLELEQGKQAGSELHNRLGQFVVMLEITTEACYTYFRNMVQGELKICRFQVGLPLRFIYLPV